DVPGQQTTKAQLEMTLDVMAHSLVYWVQDLHARGLLGEGSHVFAMTSSGGTRVMPFYGAASAAKAALESHVRPLAPELGPAGVGQGDVAVPVGPPGGLAPVGVLGPTHAGRREVVEAGEEPDRPPEVELPVLPEEAREQAVHRAALANSREHHAHGV